MANIKELKKRIRSTKQTNKITSAMKLVSAAKLARAQEAINGHRPYAGELEKAIKVISALHEGHDHPFLHPNKSPKNVVLVISSNKGLCGAFNSGLCKTVAKFIDERGQNDFQVVSIGKKVKELLSLRKVYNMGRSFTFQKVDPSIDEVREVTDYLAAQFTTGEVGKVYVAYNKFISALEFESIVKQVLPLELSREELEEVRQGYPFDFKYDVNSAELLDTLIPESFFSTIHTCLLDSFAAEHGSRMTSMDNATKNCSELIRTLTLKMNKLRQAAITTELIEVVSGAETLNN